MSKSSTSHILRVEFDNQMQKDNAVHIIFIWLYESTLGIGNEEEQLHVILVLSALLKASH